MLPVSPVFHNVVTVKIGLKNSIRTPTTTTPTLLTKNLYPTYSQHIIRNDIKTIAMIAEDFDPELYLKEKEKEEDE